MPCNGGSYFCNHDHSDSEWRRRVDLLTARLCHACDLMEAAKVDMGCELNEWHYEHKLKDAERLVEAKRREDAETAKHRREQYLADVRKRLASQLSRDEQEALGMKPVTLPTKEAL